MKFNLPLAQRLRGVRRHESLLAFEQIGKAQDSKSSAVLKNAKPNSSQVNPMSKV
jgi:hypothetical protein